MTRNRFTVTMALVLTLVMLAGSGALAWQGAAAIQKPDPAAALNATDEVLQVVSRMRQLEIKSPVKSGLKTKDEIEASVIRDLDESTPAVELEASQKTLVKLGLVSKDFQLRDYIVKLLREQVAGYYEPKTKEFYLAAWLPLGEQKKVMAHELVHALQDQHFDLRRFEKWPKGDSDTELAIHALIEGEATLVMIQYDLESSGLKGVDIGRLPSLTEQLLKADTHNDPDYPVLSAAPRVLRENLQFPYVYGVGFAQSVYKNNSWRGLDTAYRELPASTEQVMHPEKYLAREAPIKIDIPDLLTTFGKDWKQVDADVNGEFGYMVVLSEFINKDTARLAAAGWGGDRYAFYENKAAGATALIEYTTWDTTLDAKEFFNAYTERTEKRYKVKGAAAADVNRRVYQTGEGVVSIELRDKDVVMIEGAQTRQQLAQLQERVWQSKKAPR